MAPTKKSTSKADASSSAANSPSSSATNNHSSAITTNTSTTEVSNTNINSNSSGPTPTAASRSSSGALDHIRENAERLRERLAEGSSIRGEPDPLDSDLEQMRITLMAELKPDRPLSPVTLDERAMVSAIQMRIEANPNHRLTLDAAEMRAMAKTIESLQGRRPVLEWLFERP
ncbi:uncharacterized protein DSM5745_03963 [Aspergillus mulundensis]|uniref:Uncharacterized protein n=1 Tax=Aspergillus mulundensis TaxID=1810919 RepID=A0A3D8SB97_9EURO|nr:hypothetical protein DSM5745_03963 [Aspergillus mulundensis]RDW83637.1 hypothetical protein DSM5745_03963 [Aspergillus mulundensis]